MTATFDICTIATYLEDVIRALRRRGIPVETGYVSAVRRAGRQLNISLGTGPRRLSRAELAWQPIVGWSITTAPPRPRQWVLPLGVLADPDAIANTIQNLATSLRTQARRDRITAHDSS